jgi:hypothetical protein
LPHITGGLPSLPSLTGLTGRHSAEADQADRDQAPHPGVEALPGGNGDGDGFTNSHANGDGRHAGDDLRDGHPPPDLAHAQDNEPADQPADHPNP